MNRDELDAIKEVASIRIEEILDTLDISYTAKYNYYTSTCPVHLGNNKTAWSWHIEKQMWMCFSRSCQDTYGHDIFGLVAGVRECSFSDAVDFVKRFVSIELTADEIKKLRDQKENRAFIEGAIEKCTLKHYDPAILANLSYHDYLEKRGYPRELIESYQIGACLQPNKYMSNRVVVPVCDVDGNIVGFTGRTLYVDWEERSIPKWKHSLGTWVSSSLFNINNAVGEIRHTGRVVIVEGPLDVLRLEEAGVRNSVALMGKKLHSGQMTILTEVGAFTILDALDNDTAGRIGSEALKKSASCLFDVEKISIPAHYKDIGEMPLDEIRIIFKLKGVCT